MTPRAEAALKCIRTDLGLLRTGEWIPDDDSIDCTLDQVDILEAELNESHD